LNIRRVHDAVHVVGVLRIVVLEAPGIERRGDAHGDAFGSAFGEDRGAVDLLAVDVAALEEFGHFFELVPGLRRGEVAVVLLLELGLDLGLGEPVLAIDPAQGVAHGRQRPIIRRPLRPGRIGVDGGGQEIVHADLLLLEEVVQLDVVAVLGRAADPLAVADDQVAEFAVGIQLVQHAVGEVRPGHEFELHVDAGLRGEVLGKFDQGVGRVPGGPAQGDLLAFGSGLIDRSHDDRRGNGRSASQ
jgi:hypothetical protein